MPGRLLFLSLLALLCVHPNADAEAKRFVFQTVHVLTMDDPSLLREQDVFIKDGRIESVHPTKSQPVPEGAQVIEGKGGYLMPGLAEMHAHVPGEDHPEALRDDMLFLYLSNGVTLARGMLGEPWHLSLREALDKGDKLGPRLITSGPSLNGNSVDSPEHGAKMVREQAEAGYDFLKIHPGLSRDEFDAMAKTAEAQGMPFAGHVPEAAGIHRALEAAYASIEHLDGYPRALLDDDTLPDMDPGFFDYRLAPHAQPEAIEAIAQKTREAGVWNVPTETLMHNVLLMDPAKAESQRPEMRYLPAAMVERWKERVRQAQAAEDYDREAAKAFVALRKDLIKALHEAGAGLLLGSDAPQIFNVPGFSIHHEMAIMEAAGLSPYEVLRTGTVNPARFFDAEEDWGRVQAGLYAELILLRDNPLENLDHLRDPQGVMTRHHWLDAEAIEKGRQAIETRYRRD